MVKNNWCLFVYENGGFLQQTQFDFYKELVKVECIEVINHDPQVHEIRIYDSLYRTLSLDPYLVARLEHYIPKSSK